MKTLRYLALCFLFASPLAQAQVPVYATQIKDAFEHPIAVAKLCFVPVDATKTPVGFRAGSSQIVPNEVCGSVTNGVLQSGLGVAPTPAGVYYHVYLKQAFSNNILRDYGMTPITASWTLDSFDPNLVALPVSTISVGTITTLAPGSPASCNISGVGPYLLNCGIPSGFTGAQGPIGGPTSGVNLTPPASQTVTQPAGTTLGVNSLNGVLNASLFSGADIGAKINAAFASCSNTCVVVIPPGTYTYSTTIAMSLPTQSLIGQGSGFTTLNYIGSGDAVLWQMNPFTVAKAGTLKGLTFLCTSGATNCIHSGSIQGSTWEDLVVAGATKANAAGILLENALINGFPAWTERTYMHNVQVGSSAVGNTRGLDFRANGGRDSFGYSDFDIWLNVGANQIGIDVETGTSPYHSTFVARGNIDAEPATFLRVAGNMINDNLFIAGETGGATLADVANDIVITSTGSVVATGSIMVANAIGGIPNNNLSPPNIAAGGIYKVGAFTDFNYPGGSNFPGSQNNVIEKAALPISADGTVQIAFYGGGPLTGRFILEWPNNASRYDAMTIDVSCGPFEGQPCLLSSSNYALANSVVLSNPKIYRDSAGVLPYLTVDVGNRNGGSRNLIVTWMGSAASMPTLFPTGTLSTRPQLTYGYSFSQSGSNVFQSTATGGSGTCSAPTGFISATINGAVVHLATCP